MAKTIISYEASHDLLCWALEQKGLKITMPDLARSKADLSEILSQVLPDLERDLALASYSNGELLEALSVKRSDQVAFLAGVFHKLDVVPFVKDQLWEKMGISFTFSSSSPSFTIPGNRLKGVKPFTSTEFIRKPEVGRILDTPLKKVSSLPGQRKQELIRVLRYSLLLLGRETDPLTYLEESTLQFHTLDRGLSIATYGMTEERQLPLESYIGYTLFKDGQPAAYGGAWVFGNFALFGINIFEHARGGESAYMMCQILRTYRQLFGITRFEVEPYQYGEGNPEGIETGAYWFYYKLGFRSMDKKLLSLAESEWRKITKDKLYRTSKSNLIKFTGSNIALVLEKENVLYPYQVRAGVSEWIAQQFKSDRNRASSAALKTFPAHVKTSRPATESAMIRSAYDLRGSRLDKALKDMAVYKVKSPVQYNRALKMILRAIR